MSTFCPPFVHRIPSPLFLKTLYFPTFLREIKNRGGQVDKVDSIKNIFRKVVVKKKKENIEKSL